MSFLLLYNYQKKLKSLNYKTPYDIIVDNYNIKPYLFKDIPTNKFVGLNKYWIVKQTIVYVIIKEWRGRQLKLYIIKLSMIMKEDYNYIKKPFTIYRDFYDLLHVFPKLFLYRGDSRYLIVYKIPYKRGC